MPGFPIWIWLTRAAHSKNAESVTFLYSCDSRLDAEAIFESIGQFDVEWQRDDITFDLTQEFLQQVLAERDRRAQLKEPVIESINPDEFAPGETTQVEITGQNLDKIESIEVVDDQLVKITIDSQDSERIIGQVEVDPEHPPIKLTEFKVTTTEGTYHNSPENPPAVSQSLEIPDFSEIEGFKQAVEIILAGNHGTPNDFLYWLAQQRPRQFRV